MSALPLLSWSLLLLLHLSSSSSSDLHPVSLHPRRHADCPSCALARMRRSDPEEQQQVEHQQEEVQHQHQEAEEAQQDVVEAVKRHILNMLHLQHRPNVTRPVPRAALLNALRKLHVGRLADDGSLLIDGAGRGGASAAGGGGASATSRDDGGEENQETTEIITFAEAGEVPGVVNFVLSKDGGDLSLVEQANVWLFLRLSKSNRSRAKVTIRLFQQRRPSSVRPPQDDVPLAEKTVDTRRSGWHSFPVSASVQKLLESGGSTLSLRVTCDLCSDSGATLVLVSDGSQRGVQRDPSQRDPSQRDPSQRDPSQRDPSQRDPSQRDPSQRDPSQRDQSHRPFLMAVVRQGDGGDSRRRRKRGLECDGKVRVCCKRQFYVNFKDIGWNDWIIAPPGYHANYCEGECPSHVASITGSTLSFHSTVISHYRMRGYSPFQNLRSCCVPTRLRAMSMLYYNEEQKIIKKDIQNMIVEECGCS